MSIDTKFLNGTRFLLSMWVVVGHFYAIVGGQQFYNIPLLGRFLQSSSIAVDGFMVITGFLMAYHYILRENEEPYLAKDTIIKFWLRRFFRLYPVYLLAILSAYFLAKQSAVYQSEILMYFTGSLTNAWGIASTTYEPSLATLITHLTFIHGLIPEFVSDLLGPAWSLSLEMQFYIIFPFLFTWFFTSRISERLLLLIVSSIIISALMPKLFGLYLSNGILAHFGQPSIILYKLPLFIIGILFACVGLKKIHPIYFLLGLCLVMIFQGKLTNLVVLSIAFFMFLDYLKDCMSDKIYLFLLMLRNVLSNRISTFGAEISYSLYLIHMLILPFVLKFIINTADSYGMSKNYIAVVSLVVFIGVTVMVSSILYWTIEKNFIIIGRKVINKIETVTWLRSWLYQSN